MAIYMADRSKNSMRKNGFSESSIVRFSDMVGMPRQSLTDRHKDFIHELERDLNVHLFIRDDQTHVNGYYVKRGEVVVCSSMVIMTDTSTDTEYFFDDYGKRTNQPNYGKQG